ncbi:hypothetical protein LPJ72_006008 [Coemansia sp. Benny D160-2]|nr:hypothetical protein LPJ72_006008 [Coemansia sp. Benny D160-2]
MNKKHAGLQGSKSFAIINIRASATDKASGGGGGGYYKKGYSASCEHRLETEAVAQETKEQERAIAVAMADEIREDREKRAAGGRQRTMGPWQTYGPSSSSTAASIAASTAASSTAASTGAAHRGVLTSSVFQAQSDAGASIRQQGRAASLASSVGESSSIGGGNSSGWLSSSGNAARRGGNSQSKGKGTIAAAAAAAGEGGITPFNLDATTLHTGAAGGERMATATAAAAAVTVHVHYPADDAWKLVMFPPGVSVGQARDICLLKFNVWRRIMEREQRENGTAVGSTEKAAKDGKPNGSVGSGDASAATRDRYALYWPARSQWLDGMTLLSMYTLAADDVVELQEVRAFVRTANTGGKRRIAAINNSSNINNASSTTVGSSSGSCSGSVEPRKAEPEESLLRVGAAMMMAPLRRRGSNGTMGTMERKASSLAPLSAAVTAEGRLHYLQQGRSISAAWRELWVELRGSALVCYKKQPPSSMQQQQQPTLLARPKPVVVVDLAGGFRAIGSATPAHARASSSKGGSASIRTSSSSSSASSMVTAPLSIASGSDALLLGAIASSRKQLGAASAPLIIKCAASAQVHIFCAQSAAVHSYWMLALGYPPAPAAPSVSAAAPPVSPVRARAESMASLGRSARMVARQEVFQLARSPSPQSGSEQQQNQNLVPPTSSSSTASSSSLVHRRVGSRDMRVPARVMIRPLCGSSSNTASRTPAALACTAAIAADDLAAADRDHDLCGVSMRRSRSFVSTLSRVEWPMPPSTTPIGHRLASADDELCVPSHPSLDAVGLRADAASASASAAAASAAGSATGLRAPLATRFPWFRRNYLSDPHQKS